MTFAFTRDLAKYRHNTRWWMRQHRTWLSLAADRPRPRWLAEIRAKDMTGAI